MSITVHRPYAQPESGSGSADQSSYPVAIYRGPITNVGLPLPNGRPAMRHVDLEYVVEGIREGRWAKIVDRVRESADHKDARGVDGKRSQQAVAYDEAKRRLPFWTPAGRFVEGHRHAPDQRQPATSEHGKSFPACAMAEGLYPPVILSGLRFLELDHLNDPEDLARERTRIEAHPSVVSCWLSAGGHGLHVTVAMEPAPATNAEAHMAFEVACAAIEISATGDASVKNLARVAFVSHDPEAHFNRDARPLVWGMPETPTRGPFGADSGEAEPHQSHGEARKWSQTDKTATEAEKLPPGTPSTKNGATRERYAPRNDASGDLIARSLASMIAGQAGHNDSHTLAVMGNMIALGYSFDEFDQWAAAAGCTCNRRHRWDNPPMGRQSDKPGWAIVNLAEKHYKFQFRKGTGAGSKQRAKATSTASSIFAAAPPKPPTPSWDHLAPDYQAAWIAHAAAGALVIVRDLKARKRDGEIDYRLLAVDPETGRLDDGELMTKHRIQAAKLYLGATINLEEGEFAACARHARQMRDAKNAAKIAANVGSSREQYPDVWKDVPIYTPLELDADLSVIGTPSGVWSVPDARLLTPAEARDRLCTTSIRWDCDPKANHPVALDQFDYLYGDLQHTATREFARWRQAATALVRRPMREIVVKISPTGSAKTTEGMLQENVFYPLVRSADRAAIEQPSPYNSGGSSHNSYLRDFGRPARRINVPEIATDDRQLQKPLNSQLLRDLSEKSTIRYRDPGPYLAQDLPYSAHLFVDGNMPRQGSDLLQIANPDSDNAKAVKSRLRGSPYAQIPEAQQRPELLDYGDPSRAANPQETADIADFNRTILRLMLDGMAKHWDLLMEPLPHDSHSQKLIDSIQALGKAEWLVQWLPHALQPAGPHDFVATSRLVYVDYNAWHEEHGEGKPINAGVVGKAIINHYSITPRNTSQRVDGRSVRTTYYDGWTLAM